jgi:hypothetical protein
LRFASEMKGLFVFELRVAVMKDVS